jgi:hypothetical protein
MGLDWLSEETVARYTAELSTHRAAWAWVSVILVAAGLSLLLVRARLPGLLLRQRRVLTWLVLLAVCAFGLHYAWQLRWLADDAFISFRYARNLTEGKGLVFNDGERVEGYTNFLWTLILSGFLALGLDAPQVSIVLTLACLAGCLLVTTRLVHDELERRGQVPFLSVAAFLLAGNYTFASFGTSGLETMFASLLVLLAVERAARGALVTAGAAGIAATMAHPDHAIFYALLGALLVLRSRPWAWLRGALRRPVTASLAAGARGWRHNLLGYAAPFVLVYLPYFAWRTAYYGDLFPNTYYAKSGSEWYLSQGFEYLAISGITSGLWAVVPLALFGIWRQRASLVAQFTLVAVPLYLLYVAKIGGDFMLGRLLCPAMPPLLVMAELGLMALLLGTRWWQRASAFLTLPSLALVATPTVVIAAFEKYRMVADERTFYELTSFDPIVVNSIYSEQARALNTAFASAVRPPKFGTGCVGIIGYDTSLPLFDYFGLTDPDVARLQIKNRGRPGHEKRASEGDALRAGTDFAEADTFPMPYNGLTPIQVGDFQFQLLKYDAALLEPLRAKRAVSVTNFEGYLKRWRAPRSVRKLACDAWFMSQFYFRVNDRARADKAGSGALRQLTNKLPPGLVDWVIYAESPRKAGFQPLWHWSFDEPLSSAWQLSGDAFEREPRRKRLPDQPLTLGHEGGFVSSYHPYNEDAGRGELRSPPVVLQGDVITLRVGGGRSENLSVRLLIDDEIVTHLTGCDSTQMYRWAWDIRAYRGRVARVVIVDESEDDGGSISVDEIGEWRAATSAAAAAPGATVSEDPAPR